MVANQLTWDRVNSSAFIPIVMVALLILAALFVFWVYNNASTPPAEYIVQAGDAATAAALVEYVGGEVTHELGVINAVGAKLTDRQLSRLHSANTSIRIYQNSAAQVDRQGGAGSTDTIPLP